ITRSDCDSSFRNPGKETMASGRTQSQKHESKQNQRQQVGHARRREAGLPDDFSPITTLVVPDGFLDEALLKVGPRTTDHGPGIVLWSRGLAVLRSHFLLHGREEQAVELGVTRFDFSCE